MSEAGCGRTRIRKRWQGVPAECIYGPDGSLFAPKVGRRYVSTSYGAACS